MHQETERKIHKPNGHKKLIIGFVLMVLVGSGCAGSMGSLQSNESVTALFQNYQWIEGYQYYHYSAGWLSRRTYALMGIKAPYTVQSTLWQQIENHQELKSIINDMIRMSKNEPQGFEILNTRGEKIGVWYSSIFGSSVRFTNDTGIVPQLGPKSRQPSRL